MRTLLLVSALGCWFLFAPKVGAAPPKKEMVPSLIKSLENNRDAKVRAGAAEDLGHIGAVRAVDAEPALPALRQALKDKDAGVRRTAAEALGKIAVDAKETVPALIDALADPAVPVRGAAATALGQFGSEAKDAVPALQKAQKEADKKQRKVFAQALQRIRGGK